MLAVIQGEDTVKRRALLFVEFWQRRPLFAADAGAAEHLVAGNFHHTRFNQRIDGSGRSAREIAKLGKRYALKRTQKTQARALQRRTLFSAVRGGLRILRRNRQRNHADLLVADTALFPAVCFQYALTHKRLQRARRA